MKKPLLLRPSLSICLLLILVVSPGFAEPGEAPVVVSVQPATGSENVPLNAPIVIQFSKRMNPEATRIQAVNVLAFPPRLLEMSIAWSADGTQMINTPTAPYAANSQIQWQILTALDTEGLALTGLRGGAFLTGVTFGMQPKLLSADPPNQATNVPSKAAITFTFNVPMNQTSTHVRFFEMADFANEFAATHSWNAEGKVLTCIAVTDFPSGMVIGWRIEGVAADGALFPGAGGGFVTAGTPPSTPVAAVLSLGAVYRQTEADLWEAEAQEFAVLANSSAGTQLLVATPGGKTNVLSDEGEPGALGYTISEDDPAVFGAGYPAGNYQLLVGRDESELEAQVEIPNGTLPPVARFEPWSSARHVVLGQSMAVGWSMGPGGPPVDYLRLRIMDGGRIIFATPLPGEPGALTSESNRVVVPSSAFDRLGRAELSLAAFSFVDAQTNSAQQLTLHAARHRSVVHDLRIVDGNEPPPRLLRTNLLALPIGEPLLVPLVSTNGIRPIRCRVATGQLPPGVILEPSGILTGTAAAEGLYEAGVEATDLLGRSVTQAVRVGTVPLPAGSVPPKLENPALAGAELVLELVEPTGFNTILERSGNLAQWEPCYTNAAGSRWARVNLPVGSHSTFVRARAASGAARPPVNPLTVAPVLDQNVSASGEFDRFGGTLCLTNAGGFVFTLTVPPNALDRAATITMREVLQIGGLPLSGGLIAAVDLQPEGLLFRTPARLDIAAPSLVELSSLLGFGAEHDGARFGLQPSFLTNNTISLHLQHFSLAGAGRGTAGDASGQAQHPPDNGGKRTDQEVAEEMARCRMDPNCDINSEEEQARLQDIFVRQADAKIIPDLRNAVADESATENAVVGWLAWMKQLALTCYNGDTFNPQGSGVLESRLQLAQNLASRALLNGVKKNCELCMSGEPSRIARVATLAQLAAAVGFDPGNEPFDCIEKCMKFEVRIYSTITSEDSEKTVETETSAKVKLSQKKLWAEQWRVDFEGKAGWQVDQTKERVGDKCVIFKAPSSGTAEMELGIWFFRTRSYGTDAGQFVSYEWDPQVLLLLGPEVEKMPKENRRINCKGVVSREVADVFGPAFLSFHNDETVPADPARGLPPAIVMNDFTVQSGIVLANTQYLRTETLKDGITVKENTYLTIMHKR